MYSALHPQMQYVMANYDQQGFLRTGFDVGSGDEPRATIDSTLEDLALSPLLHQPGEVGTATTPPIYGLEYDVLGAVISAALRMAGLYSGSCAKYCQAKILGPLGMTNSWLYHGQSQPPSDARSKLASLSITRFDTVGQIDTSVPSYMGRRIWLSSVPGDSFNIEAQKFLEPQVDMQHSGTFGTGGAGPLTDYSQLLKLIANRGVHQGVRVISAQAISHMMEVSVSSPLVYPGFLIPASPHYFCPLGGRWIEEHNFQCPFPNCGRPFAATSNTFQWSSWYYGTWMVDIVSGYYAIWMTQAPMHANPNLYVDVNTLLRIASVTH